MAVQRNLKFRQYKTLKLLKKRVQDDDCFDLLLNQFIKDFKVEKSVSAKFSGQVTQDCFIRNNSKNFEKVEQEVSYTISNTKDYKHPILIIKLLYPNNEFANQIFDNYSKGFTIGVSV